MAKLTIEERYQTALMNPPPKGHRHPALAGVCALGIMASASDTEIISDVMMTWGYSTGERTEIEDTIRRQRRKFVPRSELLGQRPAPRRLVQIMQQQQAVGFSEEQAKIFVHRMLETGKETTCFADLRKLSPTQIPTEGLGQTLAYLRTLYRPSDFLFVGAREEARLKTRVKTVEAWIDALMRKRVCGVVVPAPPLVSVNRLSGQPFVNPDGIETFRCDACVVEGRYVRLEFDNLNVARQTAFWCGVISTRSLPLRALTFSGSKSIHGILEINATTRAQWDDSTTKLATLLCHDGLPNDLKVDDGFRYPSHMARTAGARRRETENEQSLLWLSPEPLRSATPPPRPPTPPPDAPTASVPVMAQKEQPLALEREKTALLAIPKKEAGPYDGLVQYRPGRWRTADQTDAEADRLLDTATELNPED